MTALPALDVVVAGAGPAGIACAVRLARLGHGGRLLVLDKARFPRPKVCGGGLTGRVSQALETLGLARRVPAVAAHSSEVRFGRFRRRVPLARPVEVVERGAFDADLLAQARAMGVEVREGEAVTGFTVTAGGVEVATSAGRHRARVLVGADGVGSVVRRRLLPASARPVRLLQAEAAGPRGLAETLAFDFTPMRDGLRGYVWLFPQPSGRLNVGLIHNPRGGASPAVGGLPGLVRILERALTGHGVELLGRPRAWPVWGYDPGRPAAGPHLLLCGDALGVNPLSGEGISPALWQGILAAEAAHDGLARGDLTFSGYGAAVRRAVVGRELVVDRRLAALLYGDGGLLRWLPLLLFDDEMVTLYAARVAGTIVLADERAKLFTALVRQGFLGKRWRRRMERET